MIFWVKPNSKTGQLPRRDHSKQTATKQLQAQYSGMALSLGYTHERGNTKETHDVSYTSIYKTSHNEHIYIYIHTIVHIYIYIYIYKSKTIHVENTHCNESNLKLWHHCICSNTHFHVGKCTRSKLLSNSPFICHSKIRHMPVTFWWETNLSPHFQSFVWQQNACYHSLLFFHRRSQIIQQTT